MQSERTARGFGLKGRARQQKRKKHADRRERQNKNQHGADLGEETFQEQQERAGEQRNRQGKRHSEVRSPVQEQSLVNQISLDHKTCANQGANPEFLRRFRLLQRFVNSEGCG